MKRIFIKNVQKLTTIKAQKVKVILFFVVKIRKNTLRQFLNNF